jgi:hypothetical protein
VVVDDETGRLSGITEGGAMSVYEGKLTAGDWFMTRDNDWHEAKGVIGNSIGVDGGGYLYKGLAVAHRSNSGPFKKGDIVTDEDGYEGVFCHIERPGPENAVVGDHCVIRGKDSWGVASVEELTLVKPIEAIEAEQKPSEDTDKYRGNVTPIPGPPDLEGVPDDALFVVKWNNERSPDAYLREYLSEEDNDMYLWHIPLGVIEEPKPEVTIEDLPTCRGGEWEYSRSYCSLGDKNEDSQNYVCWFDGASPADILRDIEELASGLPEAAQQRLIEKWAEKQGEA